MFNGITMEEDKRRVGVMGFSLSAGNIFFSFASFSSGALTAYAAMTDSRSTRENDM